MARGNPSLTGLCDESNVGDGDGPDRSVASSAVQAWEDARRSGPAQYSCDGRVRRYDQPAGALSYSVAARRRVLRGWRPGTGSAPRTYE